MNEPDAKPASAPGTEADAQKTTEATANHAPGKATHKPSRALSGRSRSREFALQALYQHLVGRNATADIDAFTRDLTGFHKADAAHYDALLHGCVAEAEALDQLILPLLDRKLAEISPIERAIMWMGAYEFQHCVDVPWRVVLNEYIELTKSFGGTDGHKYVNAVLNGLAPTLRAAEVAADKASGKAR